MAILTVGSRGDVEPFLALAVALAASGARPRLITHERFRDLADLYGVPFSPLPGDPAALMQSAAGRRALESGRNFGRFLAEFRRLTTGLSLATWDAARPAVAGADVLVHSTFAYQAHYLGRVLGIPTVSAHLQPLVPTGEFASPATPFSVPGRFLRRFTHVAAGAIFWHHARPSVDVLRARVPDLAGLGSPIPELLRGRAPLLIAVSPSVVPRPRDWPPFVHETGYWFLPPPPAWTPPRALADFVERGGEPVYVGFGSLAQRDPDATRRLVDRALTVAGVRGVVLTGWAGMTGEPATDAVMPVSDVPHAWLFPRMRVVVHHGGAGTTAAALRAGVPQVVVPHFGDQWFWAERVAALHAGVVLPRRRLTAERLARAIESAAQAAPRPLARAIAGEDGLAVAIRVIQTLARPDGEDPGPREPKNFRSRSARAAPE